MAGSTPLKEVLCSIVIRAYNEEKMIGQTLKMINAQKEAKFEVILLDNQSTDRTVEIARKYNVKVYTIKRGEFTFGSALNRGAELATGDFVVYVSAHAVPKNSMWLSELIKPFLEDSQIVGTYSRQVPLEDAYKYIFYDMERLYPVETEPKVLFSNASSAVRRETLLSYPFDEEVSSAEDLIWAIEMEAKGNKVKYVPSSEVMHSHNDNFKMGLHRAFREVYPMLKYRLIEGTLLFLPRRVLILLKYLSLDFLRFIKLKYSINDLYVAWRYRVAMTLGYCKAYLKFKLIEKGKYER